MRRIALFLGLCLAAFPAAAQQGIIFQPTTLTLGSTAMTLGTTTTAITGLASLGITAPAAQGNTLLTLADPGASGSTTFAYTTSGAGSSKELTLTASNNALNVLVLKNTSAAADSFSAIAFQGLDGVERAAFGYSNASSSVAFDQAVYIEASYYTGSSHTTLPPPLRMIQTGYLNSVYGSYKRLDFANTGAFSFFKPNGTTATLQQGVAGNVFIAANPTTDTFSVFGIRADSTSFVTGATANSSLIRLEQLGNAAAFVGYNNTALTTSDGFFRIHLDNAAATASGMTVRNDGSGPAYTAEGAGYAFAATGGSVDTGLYRGAAGVIGINGASASFPGFDRSGTTMRIRLADGSADAPLSASTATFSAISSDTAQTDNTVCVSSSGLLLKGTGALGICLGTSSVRFKRDIEPAMDGLTQIAALKPVNFFYKPGYGDDGFRRQYGFLAEDVIHTLPGLVGLDTEGRPNSVDMLAMVPILVRGMQEQQRRIVELERRVH